MHYRRYGTGFQTWEYSPLYALRSYTYILMHALPAWVYGLILQSNRVLVFYFMRCILGFICTTLETYFYRYVLYQIHVIITNLIDHLYFAHLRGVKQTYGPKVGRLVLVFLLFSAGMFQSSSAFLPSSFSM